MQSVKKIIAVLNDFSMIDEVLDKTFAFAKNYQAVVEILYVHEMPLFEIPDLFHSGDSDLPLDKNKIKTAILEKVDTYNYKKTPAVFVKIDDTADRVWALAREDSETLVIATYQKDVTIKLLNKITQPLLVIKSKTHTYQKMALIVDAASPSIKCIEDAKNYFPQVTIELIYDYRYIVDPGMEASIQNIQIIEEAQKEAFEALKEESGIDGKFFIDGEFLGNELHDYLQENNFDLLYICSHEDDFFVSDNLAELLLEDINCDMWVSNR